MTSRDKIEPWIWRITCVLIVGMVMSILDTTIVNVALRTLGEELDTTLAQIQWVATGYMLALAAVVPLTGWSARRFGAKRVYLVSIALFTLGSALCGMSDSSTELILFRVLQGLGGGMIMPLAQMIMAELAGPKRMGRVMGVVVILAMVAPILGPVVGGLILQNLHWSWIFFVNLPIGIVAFALAWRLLPESELGEAGELDWIGLALMVTSMPLVVFGLAEIGSQGSFTAPTVIWPIAGGLALTAAFGWHALRVKQPLLDVRLYANRVFSAASVATFCLGAEFYGATIMLPLYYQEVRGESVSITGLLTGPQGLGMLLCSPFAAKLTERFGGGRVAFLGVALICLATLPLAFVGAGTSIVWISFVLVIRGIGVGLSFLPTTTVAFASLRVDQLSDATPQLNVLSRIGGAIGTAVIAVVLQQAAEGAHGSAELSSAFGTAFWWVLGMSALSLIPVLVLVRAEGQRAPSEPGERLAEEIAETEVEPLGA